MIRNLMIYIALNKIQTSKKLSLNFLQQPLSSLPSLPITVTNITLKLLEHVTRILGIVFVMY